MAANLKNTSISIFTCLLLCSLVASDSGEFRITTCKTEYNEAINNQTGLIDDPFRTNLLSLFNNLASSSLSFYKTTAGESPDKAYGLYDCRSDISSDTCRACVTDLTNTLISTLSNCKDGNAYMDSCVIRYANYSFFGISNNTVSGSVYGHGFTNLSQEYNQTLDSVLVQAVNTASNNTDLFSTSQASLSSGEKVYGLAQCTRDISKGNCSACLNVALDYIQKNIIKRTQVSKGEWILLPSCQLRYDNVASFGLSPDTDSSMAPPTVSLPFLVATLSLIFIHCFIF